MVIRSFKDHEVEAFFKRGLRFRKKGWDQVYGIVRRKLDMLHYAKELNDLRSPPNNRLESLKGDLKGLYSIRLMISGALYLDGITSHLMCISWTTIKEKNYETKTNLSWRNPF